MNLQIELLRFNYSFLRISRKGAFVYLVEYNIPNMFHLNVSLKVVKLYKQAKS